MNNIQCIRFNIPDQVSAEAPLSPDPYSPKPDSTVVWTCTLTKMGDNIIRAALRPPASICRTDEENEKSGQRHCSSIQILTTSLEVLVAKNVSRFDFSKQAVDFYLDHNGIFQDGRFEFIVVISFHHPLKIVNPTGALKDQHSAMLSQAVDPMVELMTRFYLDSKTANVVFKFVPPAYNQPPRQRKAHQAILSIYPPFSERMLSSRTLSSGNFNPHQRATMEFEEAASTIWGFEQMLKFIYTGSSTDSPANIDSSEWQVVFDLGKRYQLDYFQDQYLVKLAEMMRFDKLLDVFFKWGYKHSGVAVMCCQIIAKNLKTNFRGKPLGLYLLEELQTVSKPGEASRDALHLLYDTLLQRI
ncbi:hypothetical protein BGZ93_010513 [Podila epicladia]|nr:hypothetical protein BGZ92_011308 [Podila epicladia]KAG0088229.1 hypothetical protein BGZ93_010513 [Podila epicladia]